MRNVRIIISCKVRESRGQVSLARWSETMLSVPVILICAIFVAPLSVPFLSIQYFWNTIYSIMSVQNNFLPVFYRYPFVMSIYALSGKIVEGIGTFIVCCY